MTVQETTSTVVMKPDHPKWSEFETNMMGIIEAANGFLTEPAVRLECNGTFYLTRQALEDFSNVDIEGTLHFFRACGSSCDCQLMDQFFRKRTIGICVQVSEQVVQFSGNHQETVAVGQEADVIPLFNLDMDPERTSKNTASNIMCPIHPLWIEFLYQLADTWARFQNRLREQGDESKCDNETTMLTHHVLEDFTGIDVEGTFGYFARFGALCDCTIFDLVWGLKPVWVIPVLKG